MIAFVSSREIAPSPDRFCSSDSLGIFNEFRNASLALLSLSSNFDLYKL